jgi:hypothetical protein
MREDSFPFPISHPQVRVKGEQRERENLKFKSAFLRPIRAHHHFITPPTLLGESTEALNSRRRNWNWNDCHLPLSKLLALFSPLLPITGGRVLSGWAWGGTPKFLSTIHNPHVTHVDSPHLYCF